MITPILHIQKKSLSHPDEVRQFGDGQIEFAHFDEEHSVARVTLQPGWKWSKDIQPIVGTNRCQSTHLLYILGGNLQVQMDDGTEMELQEGDTALVAPGHDAWVVGNDPCKFIDFGGMKEYSQRAGPAQVPERETDVDQFLEF